MTHHASPRFLGSCLFVAIPITFITWVTLELLRSDYNPLRNLLNDYLVGPYGLLGRVATCLFAATFFVLLVGLWLGVRPSGWLTMSCALLGVVVVSLNASALFPIDTTVPEAGRPALAGAAIVHILSAIRLYALTLALLGTLPAAYRRDENWRSLSRVTLILGGLILAFQVGFILAPLSLRGLVQRGIALVILIWFAATGLRLRQATTFGRGTTA